MALSPTSLKQLDLLRSRFVYVIEAKLSDYETEVQKFTSNQTRETIKGLIIEIFSYVLNRIEQEDTVSIEPLKQVLLEGVFKLNFNIELTASIFNYMGTELLNEIKAQGVNTNILQYFTEYRNLIQSTIGSFNFFIESSATELLQKVPQYGYSESVKTYQNFDSNGHYSPLFSSELLWENIKTRDIENEANPLVIYNNTLYKLKPGVVGVRKDIFDQEQWNRYSSAIFDQSKSFKSTYSQLINTYYSDFLQNAFSINPEISDSTINSYNPATTVDRRYLSSTFGGEGEYLYELIKKFKSGADLFGGYQGSVVGSIDYITMFMEFFMASTTGRVIESGGFNIIDDFNFFGDFEIIFGVSKRSDKKPGLKFLDYFSSTKSFLNSKKVLSAQEVEDGVRAKTFNPVSFVFDKGVDDSYSPEFNLDSYSITPSVDLLLLSIENLYDVCKLVGDSVLSVINSLDSNGRLRGFEGLGSIEMQMKELQNVFPPSQYFLDPTKGLVGFTGGIKYLLDSYSKLSSLLVYPLLLGDSLQIFFKWINLFKNSIEEILGMFGDVGIKSGNYFISNISNKIVKANSSTLISYLKSIGFKDAEIDRLISVESFTELIEIFAPVSDSSDLKSFFKGYELTQLIYEFAGEEGIDAYLNFLYRRDDIEGLLNILNISQRDKSNITNEAISKYPRLIGLIIGLTYAVDPNQLVKFNKILKGNSLSLLQQITLLLQQGEDTIIKSKEDIDLLSPMVDQLIRGNASDVFASPDLNYVQTNQTTPIALKQWTETISKNLGRVEDTNFLYRLYDKSVGLSVKELNYLLGGAKSNNVLGSIIDGFQGGQFTNILKYSNLAGLGVKLGFYKNSYQSNNFALQNVSQFTIPALLENFEKINQAINIIELILGSSLNFSFSQEALQRDVLKPIFNSQNKEINSLFNVVQGLTPISRDDLSLSLSRNLSNYISQAGNAPIIESPGPGNSRRPNRIGVVNSITPEQQSVLFEQITAAEQVTNNRELVVNSLINNFIKITEDNKLISGLVQSDETSAIERSRSRQLDPVNILDSPDKLKSTVGVQDFIQIDPQSALAPPSYSGKLANLYFAEELGSDKNIIIQALGANYLEDEREFFAIDEFINAGLVTPFSREESCKRFGGSNCEEIYLTEQETCTNPINRSLLPESYASIPGSSDENLKVDRPLGTFGDYVPANAVVPYKAEPGGLYSLLPSDSTISIGKYGEPILDKIYSTPLLYEGENGSISEYNNTEFGIIEFINAKLEKSTEFACASFSSPYFYQLCMNVLKCKKFRTQNQEANFLTFCPKYYSGGRLKP